jgi:tail tube protein gp19
MADQTARAYAGGQYLLQLDNVDAGWLASAEGGDAVSDVVEEKVGPDHVVHKHIAGVKYTDIHLAFGTGMSTALYQWIADTLKNTYSRKNGALIAADYNFNERDRLTFYNTLISRIGFPALDGSSKESAKLTLGLAPEYTRRQKGSGSKVSVQAGARGPSTKWSPADFRLKIDGLDCTAVSRIEAISIESVIVENAVGELRDYQKAPAHLEIPDLVVTLAEAKADSFYDWHEDFVIKGNNGENQEKSGTLEFLNAAMKQTLFTLSFSGLGIYKLAASAKTAGTETIRRVTASMYCQDMRFAPGPPAPAQQRQDQSQDSGQTDTSVPSALSSRTPHITVSGDFPERFTRVRTTV